MDPNLDSSMVNAVRLWTDAALALSCGNDDFLKHQKFTLPQNQPLVSGVRQGFSDETGLIQGPPSPNGSSVDSPPVHNFGPEALGSIPASVFCDLSVAVTHVINKLGMAIWPATAGMVVNVEHIQRHIATAADVLGPNPTIAELMEWERALPNRPAWDGSFECSMLWLRRALLNFYIGTGMLVDALLSKTSPVSDDLVREAWVNAYNLTLARHHTWPLRKAVLLVISYAPGLSYLHEFHTDASVSIAGFSQLYAAMNVVMEHLKQYYMEEGLDPDQDFAE